MDATTYTPNQDYSAAYEAARRRLRSGFAGQREQLQQDLATNGVRTSGVSAIPAGRLGAAQAGEEAGLGSQFALEQARNGIEDRHRSEDFAHDKEMAGYNSDLQGSIARRLAKNQLTGQIIGGGLGALGGYFAMKGAQG